MLPPVHELLSMENHSYGKFALRLELRLLNTLQSFACHSPLVIKFGTEDTTQRACRVVSACSQYVRHTSDILRNSGTPGRFPNDGLLSGSPEESRITLKYSYCADIVALTVLRVQDIRSQSAKTVFISDL